MRNKWIGASLILTTMIFVGRTAQAVESVAADDKIIKLYGSKCASCHGKDGAGKPSMAKVLKVDPGKLSLISEATAKKEDKELTEITTSGKGKMPAYKGKISDGEIAALTVFIRSLAAPKGE